MKPKSRQLSLFNDKQVERSALCRAFHNPTKKVIKAFRFENLYGIPRPSLHGSMTNCILALQVLYHRTGFRTKTTIKQNRRYFYE